MTFHVFIFTEEGVPMTFHAFMFTEEGVGALSILRNIDRFPSPETESYKSLVGAAAAPA